MGAETLQQLNDMGFGGLMVLNTTVTKLFTFSYSYYESVEKIPSMIGISIPA